MRAWALPPLVIAGMLSICACDETAGSLGATPAEARRNATNFLQALASRFGPMDVEPALAVLRPRLARSALSPSRLFADASVWTTTEGSTHGVAFSGRRAATRYRIGLRAVAPYPETPGDYRGMLNLKILGPGEYQWAMHEELGVGSVSGSELSRALAVIFHLAETRAGGDARDALRAALPRAAASLGRLFSLDSLELLHAADGATAVAVSVRLHPEGIRRAYPRYARYLENLTPTIRAAVRLHDEGTEWWNGEVQQNRLNLRLRILNGHLVSLEGTPRPMPVQSQVSIDYTIKVGFFRVGVRGLEGDVALSGEPHRRAFSATFSREPRWAIPFLFGPMMKASLRRPFEGKGSLYALGIEDGSEGETLLVQDYRVGVRESWIVRWLGGLAAEAVVDFENGPEEEEGRFTSEALDSLRQDLLRSFEGPGGFASRVGM
jgi:hypothetical protein